MSSKNLCNIFTFVCKQSQQAVTTTDGGYTKHTLRDSNKYRHYYFNKYLSSKGIIQNGTLHNFGIIRKELKKFESDILGNH